MTLRNLAWRRGAALAAAAGDGAGRRSTSSSPIHSSPSNTFWQAVKKGFDDACAKIAGQLPDGLHADRRLDRSEQVANMQAALAAQAGRADHLDRRQQRLRRRDQAARATPGVIVIASMSTTPRAPRATRARPSSARASSRPATRWRGAVEELPDGRPDPRAGRRLGARPELVRAARAGVINFLEEYKAANPGPRDHRTSRSIPAPTSPSTADRVGAYLNGASRHHRLFRHRLLARRRRAGADRPRRRAGQGAARRLRPRARGARSR